MKTATKGFLSLGMIGVFFGGEGDRGLICVCGVSSSILTSTR